MMSNIDNNDNDNTLNTSTSIQKTDQEPDVPNIKSSSNFELAVMAKDEKMVNNNSNNNDQYMSEAEKRDLAIEMADE